MSERGVRARGLLGAKQTEEERDASCKSPRALDSCSSGYEDYGVQKEKLQLSPHRRSRKLIIGYRRGPKRIHPPHNCGNARGFFSSTPCGSVTTAHTVVGDARNIAATKPQNRDRPHILMPPLWFTRGNMMDRLLPFCYLSFCSIKMIKKVLTGGGDFGNNDDHDDCGGGDL